MTDKEIYKLSRTECLKLFETSKQGLTTEEAEKRLKQNGFNEIAQVKKQSAFIKFLSQFKDVMIIILLVAAVISVAVAIIEGNSSELIDGIIIAVIVVLNAIIGFVQEHKAENAMESLKNMTKPETEVMRDGELIRIKSKNLVVGDIVVLEAGDIVPADLRLIESANLTCDESSLTGESHTVEKFAEYKTNTTIALAERKNMLYSGTVITNGRAVGVVVAVGKDTEIGKIAQILATTEKEETPIQKNIKNVGKIITVAVLIVALITFVTELVLRPEEPIIEAFLIAVALAVAAIPESLPTVITIIMSIGVSKLAKKRAIVKRLHSVETLGCCEVICSDKTGTLTQNVMTVTALYYSDQISEAKNNLENPDFEMLLKCMTLCNDSIQNRSSFVGDPTETALTKFSYSLGFKKKEVEEKFPRVNEISFDSVRKMMTTVNKIDEQNYHVYTKGAVDNIIKVCSKIQINGNIVDFTDQEKQKILQANDELASKALRVLAFAYKPINHEETENSKGWEKDLIFIGLVGMIDPPRKEVKQAIKKCAQAGMRAVMITGDHKATAFAIAKEIGLVSSIDEVMLGVEIDKLNDEEFIEKLKTVNVFARVSPENKVRIVEGFKKLGKVVAMTGDGVNDAPSLKASNIGVGMGITGTDVTKEVSDIIVTDDNFATIVLAVEEGRKIYKNIQKTIKFLFAANIGEVLSIFIATLVFPHFIFLLPIQILFVNLITDSLPAIAMGFEAAEKNLMEEPPRKSTQTVFSNGVAQNIIFIGIIQTVLILLSFVFGLYVTVYNPETFAKEATTMAFITLNLIQLFYTFSARLDSLLIKNNPFKNKLHVLSVVLGLGILLLFTLTPLHTLLGLVKLNWIQWIVAVSMAILVVPLSELVKVLIAKKYKTENQSKKVESKKAIVKLEK